MGSDVDLCSITVRIRFPRGTKIWTHERGKNSVLDHLSNGYGTFPSTSYYDLFPEQVKYCGSDSTK